MGRGKDDFIAFSGGLRPDETPDQLAARLQRLTELTEMLAGHRPRTADIDSLEAERRHLAGEPSVEWDYDDPND